MILAAAVVSLLIYSARLSDDVLNKQHVRENKNKPQVERGRDRDKQGGRENPHINIINQGVHSDTASIRDESVGSSISNPL